MDKMKEFELILFKPNELIEIESGNITTVNRLAYNYIIHKLQKNGSNFIKLNIADFFKDLKLGKNYDELISYLDSLQKVRVVSKDSKGKLWGAFNLLSYFKANDDGTFDVEIPNIIFNSLCGQEQFYYTTIQLLEERKFKCSYGAFFYEVLKKYEKINIPIFEISSLRALTGTENKYLQYKDFKRYVLEKSIKELNEIDKIFNYSFEEIKVGRKVSSIQFLRNKKIEEKKVLKAEIVEDVQMSDKLINAIKKAKKSLYVQSAYSQKAMDKLIKKYDEKLIIKALGEVAKYNQEIKSFLSIMTSKIEDLKNSSNKALDEKMEKREKGSPNLPKDEIQLQENDVVSDEVEHLKKLFHHQAKDQGKLSPIMESLIKACRTKEDIKMVANDFKIELNLELF